MDFDEVLMKKTGFCRCCLTEGFFKDLQLSYLFDDHVEVYENMLIDSLNIYISQHVEGPNGPTRLICEVCITRLRDACNFKKQVQDCEKRFVDMLHRGEFRSKELAGMVTKSEIFDELGDTGAPVESNMSDELADTVIKSEMLDELGDTGAPVDSDMSDEDTKPLMTYRSQQADDTLERDTAVSQDTITAQVPVKRGRGRPRKSTVDQKTKRKTYDGALTRRRQKNLQVIFNNTTVMPFKWRGKYLCFYCGKNFQDYASLRKHTLGHGKCSDKDFAIQQVRSSHHEVKIDVSELACEVCNEPFEDVKDVAMHLHFKHNMTYDLDLETTFTQYRLVDLTCTQCGEVANTFKELVRHVNKNHPADKCICDQCSKEFPKKKDLDGHIRSFHKIGGHKCDECGDKFESFAKLTTHRDNNHGHVCDVCFQSFPSKDERRSHMNATHIKDGGTNCALCDSFCETRHSYWQHLRNCKAKKEALLISKPQKVKRAQKRYNEVRTIRNNIACLLNMSNLMPFKFYLGTFRCYFCQTNHPDAVALRKHTNSEHPVCDVNHRNMKLRTRQDDDLKVDTANLTCKLCQLRLENLDTLIDHLVAEHDASYDKTVPMKFVPFVLEKDKYPCLLCKERPVFVFFGNLLRHLNDSHSGNKVICAFCGEAFRSKNNMRSHIKKHHAPPTITCPDCDLAFRTPLKLATHVAKAHGKKVFKCVKCPETFTTPYLKRRHMILDHNVGSKCTYCGKMFIGNAVMLAHVKRTHLKEKTVECPVCHVRMFDTYMMKVHMVRHDGERNFHCDVCGKKFLWKKNLRNHMSVHDGGKASGA